MCTVVCRWNPHLDVPVQLLAVRDEFASRVFDLPGAWWPDHPGVVGGRDARAGGSWCVSDIALGVTAVVLNRPERMVADAGAASRGVLPLLATRYGPDWPDHVDVGPMAGFTLVLVAPDVLTWWTYIGDGLERLELPTGTHMFTPRGLSATASAFDHADLDIGVAQLSEGPTDAVWVPWLEIVRHSSPTGDRTGLLVRREIGTETFESVFAQFLAARPGRLRLDHLSRVARDPLGSWTTQFLRSD